MKRQFVYIIIFALFIYTCKKEGTILEKSNVLPARTIMQDSLMPFVKQKAIEVVKTGFNAGDGYQEVWIRDYNTFIELSAQVFDRKILKENLLVFFRMQGKNGNIIDGFTPIEMIKEGETDFIYTKLEPRYAGHKNTVETDQETSLIQSVYKYIQITNDTTILNEQIGKETVAKRMEKAMKYLMEYKFDKKYGLIIGATTADWGDVQPEHVWGVDIDENTHYAIDIYDNAMFIIALENLMEMLPKIKEKWQSVRDNIFANCRKHLWDTIHKKFIPHIYISDSPFPSNFNENEIYYHGGTSVAIEAGLLSKEEIKISLVKMIENVKKSGAGSIGLTLYPPYPKGFYKNKGMYPYGYQNGGDWTWFGGRMIQQLIKYGFVDEAYEQALPMFKRVKDNNGFFEWYTKKNEPKGSATFRGSAGVLWKAIQLFEENK